MLSFINYPQAKEQIEIIADEEGIDELIYYLQNIKSQKDHMHLTIGSELDEIPIPTDRNQIVSTVKSVRLEFSETRNWH